VKDVARRGAPLPDREEHFGSVQAGTTVSDSADDEHERQLSISMSLEHTEWQDRKVNLIDVPGDLAFQGELRCAARVVEGALVTVSAVMGVETIGRMKGLSPRHSPPGRQGYISQRR